MSKIKKLTHEEKKELHIIDLYCNTELSIKDICEVTDMTKEEVTEVLQPILDTE